MTHVCATEKLLGVLLCVCSLWQVYWLPSVLGLPCAVIYSPFFARVLCGLSHLILMTSCEAAGPVVFQMRKVRPDRLNPCFSNLTAHHGHLWEFCKVLFGVPGGGDQSLLLKKLPKVTVKYSHIWECKE